MSGGAPTLRPVRNRSCWRAPGVAAAAIDADRQIADQADPHAGVLGRLLRRGEGAVGQPLQEGVNSADRRPIAGASKRDMAGEACSAAVAHEGVESPARASELRS